MRAVRSNRFRMSRLVPWTMNRNPAISASLRPDGRCSTIRSDLTNVTCLAGTAPSSWLARSGSEALASGSKRRWYGCESISNRGAPRWWTLGCHMPWRSSGCFGHLVGANTFPKPLTHRRLGPDGATGRVRTIASTGCLGSQRDAASGRLRSASLSPVLGGYSSPVLSSSES